MTEVRPVHYDGTNHKLFSIVKSTRVSFFRYLGEVCIVSYLLERFTRISSGWNGTYIGNT